MENKVILSADSTIDLSEELLKKYNVMTIPLHIILNGQSYDDLVNITPDDIYDNFEKTGTLPKTSAINCQEYIDRFKPYVDQGYQIVHINIGGALSTSHNQCCMAAKELGNVYPVDSCSLSTGSGLLVIEAAKRIAQGMSAEQVADEIRALTPKSYADFVVDKLTYLRAGGRCSALAAMGANLLSIRPRIDVHNEDGSMSVGKKYRGKLNKVFETYIEEKFSDINSLDNERAIITHSGVDKEVLDLIYGMIEAKNYFKEILITRASCTISSHCGPGTLGVMVMRK